MGTTEETLSLLRREAFSGSLSNASTEKLNEYAAALCHSQAFSMFGAHEFPQVCETVRIHLLRAHIEVLQKHITTLDEKNTRLSWLVIVLTVASLIGTASQIWYADKADKRAIEDSKPIAEKHIPTQTTSPTQVSPVAKPAIAEKRKP